MFHPAGKRLIPGVAALVWLALSLPAGAAGWKLESTQTLPAPAPGVTHFAQTIAGSLQDGAPVTEATLQFVVFDPLNYTLRIFDQGIQGRQRLDEVMQQNHCLAGCNGGYFRADFDPVGMLMADGKLIQRPEHARLLSGALLVAKSRLRLVRSTEPMPGRDTRQALQCGPFLVEGGKAVPGLNNIRSARRTAILTDGAGQWALVSASEVTLEELGAILADEALLPAGLHPVRALNLDGGSSTALWVQQPGAEPYSAPEIGIVRDFIGIVPR